MEKIQPRKGMAEVTIGKEYPKSEAEEMQLPLERLMPLPLVQSESVDGMKACTFCEYLLHYIQDAITNPVTEVTRILNFMKCIYVNIEYNTYLQIYQNLRRK